jgi:hypothetical protein
MHVELNRTTFVRLVQLYVLTLALEVGAAIYESFGPNWSAFSSDFDALAEQHFSAPSEPILISLAVFYAFPLLWGLASIVGLLWFKKWARFGFWASVVLFMPTMFIAGMYPYFVSPWTDLARILSGALFGAILLLAYSRDHGAIWFNSSHASHKVT